MKRLACILLVACYLTGCHSGSHLPAMYSVAADQKVFFGNLHSHTSYSDGSGTPEQAYRHARFTAGLDFLAITEHNHHSADGSGDRKDGVLIAKDHSLYTGPGAASLIPTAGRWIEAGKFVALYGQEVSSISAGNHVNVFDVNEVIDDQVVPNGNFKALTDWLATHKDSLGLDPLLQFNHPALLNDDSIEYGADDFGSQTQWIATMGRYTGLIEVMNGPAMAKTAGNRPAEVMEKDYKHYLSLGFYLAPTADQDNHYFTWGTTTDARTAVIAESLTKEKLLQAMRSRHVYATDDRNLQVIYTVTLGSKVYLNGDRVVNTDMPATGSILDIGCSIKDTDEPDASYQVEVHVGWQGEGPAELVKQVSLSGNGDHKIQGIKYTGGRQYVFLKLIQSDEDGESDRTWTAPIWLEPGYTPTTPTGPVTPAGPDVASFVASKKSEIYHLSLDCRDAKSILVANRVFGEDAKKDRRLHTGCPR